MPISHRLDAGVAWLTLDRPEAMNSLDRETLDQAAERLAAWRSDPEVRVIVVTGRGRAFCAGADLKQAGKPAEPGEKDLLDRIVDLLDTLRDFPKPVIAAVNGLALAGGLEIVLACDIVIASEAAKFGDAHSNFGVFPGGGGAAVLPRKIPANVAKYLLFTGDMLGALEAKVYGLANLVVPAEELEAAAQALAEKLARKSGLVLARMKRVANEAADKKVADALRHELLECRNHSRSWDLQEGLAAFREKREPQFRGY